MKVALYMAGTVAAVLLLAPRPPRARRKVLRNKVLIESLPIRTAPNSRILNKKRVSNREKRPPLPTDIAAHEPSSPPTNRSTRPAGHSDRYSKPHALPKQPRGPIWVIYNRGRFVGSSKASPLRRKGLRNNGRNGSNRTSSPEPKAGAGESPNILRKAVRAFRSFAYGGEERRPRVGLALGGGFARGIAHVGVIRVLEAHNIPIDLVCGTSVGALVAATYASGTSLGEMERQGAETQFRDFGRWTISRLGIATNERLETYLQKFTTKHLFSEMKVPLVIVATDLIEGKTVHFTEGEIGPALRASCAYPGLFLPVEHEGRILVDGFLTELVPSVAAKKMGADIVIAVHLEPGLLDTAPRSMIEVISRSFSILQSSAVQSWRAATDVLIEPNVHHILWDEFSKTPQLVAAGEAAAHDAIPKIKALLDKRFSEPANPPDDKNPVRTR
jgi:NTE family protein